MTTKNAIIATVIIMIGAVLLGLAVLLLFFDLNVRNANERAALLGQGVAKLCVIPLAVVWIMWGARFRKDREQRQRSRASGGVR